MGIVRSPIPVKLFIGMLSPDAALFDVCEDILCKEFGPLDRQSEVHPWGRTDYYQDEMGAGILRKFIFFERLIDAGKLPEIKLRTNALEESLADTAADTIRRRVNLDPGYITEAKVVLATTKDFSHRVYIGKSIYAEVTLAYSSVSRSFVSSTHTYPDYGTASSLALFKAARTTLREQLNKHRTRKRGGGPALRSDRLDKE